MITNLIDLIIPHIVLPTTSLILWDKCCLTQALQDWPHHLLFFGMNSLLHRLNHNLIVVATIHSILLSRLHVCYFLELEYFSVWLHEDLLFLGLQLLELMLLLRHLPLVLLFYWLVNYIWGREAVLEALLVHGVSGLLFIFTPRRRINLAHNWRCVDFWSLGWRILLYSGHIDEWSSIVYKLLWLLILDNRSNRWLYYASTHIQLVCFIIRTRHKYTVK